MTANWNDGKRAIEIFYRPIRKLSDKLLCGYYSEIRINDKAMGVLTPDRYRYISEKTNQCIELSKWGIENTCQGISHFSKKEIRFDFVTTYVSLECFLKDDFIGFVKDTLKKYDVSRTQLCFEISSDYLVKNDTTIEDAIKAIRALGVKIAVNNFMNINCSLAELPQKQIDFVIPTIEFTKKICGDDREREFSKSIIKMLENIEIEMILTGIKDGNVYDYVSVISQFGVGDYFGKFTTERYVRKD